MEKLPVKTSFGSIIVHQNRKTGFPVVLVHGNSLSALTFNRQMISPLIKDFRLIAPDLPGHGDTGRNENPEIIYSPSTYIKIIIELYSELDITGGILVGHSLGGHIIINALEYLPDVRGAMIFGTPPLTAPAQLDKAFIAGPSLALILKPDLTDEEKILLAKGFVRAGTDVPAEIQQSIIISDPLVRLYIGKALMGGKSTDEVQKIKEFKKPVAILHGESDQLVNPDYLHELKLTNLWEDKIHIIKGAGHSPQVEQPDLFNEILMRFVEDCRIS